MENQTLIQWFEQYRIPYGCCNVSSVFINVDDVTRNAEALEAMYHLSDYYVSGMSGGCYWLHKKTVTTENTADKT